MKKIEGTNSVNEIEVLTYFHNLDLDPEVLRGKRILDLGAGEGRFQEELKERGIEANVVSLDISKEVIQRAQEKKASDRSLFLVAKSQEMPLDRETFNLILMRGFDRGSEGLHNKNLWGEIERLLTPDGEIRIAFLVTQADVERLKTLLPERLSISQIIEKDKEIYLVVLKKRTAA